MPIPVTAVMQELVDAFDKAIAEDPMSLSTREQIGNGDVVATLRGRLDYLQARLINAIWASEATVEVYGQSVKGWLVHDQHLSPADAGARIAVARQMLVRDGLAEALATGAISHNHARAIAQTLRKFPDPNDQDLVERELVDAARHCDPAALGRACRDLIQHLNLDETAEERYARLYGDRYLKLSSTFEGMTRIDGMLDPVLGAALKAALTALSVRQGSEDDRTKPQRDHDALAALIDHALRTGDLPEHGGSPPQVIVTTQLDTLRNDVEERGVPTTTVDGEPIPAAELRRIACDAGVIPAVLGGASEVLDLGRSTRTWSKSQRVAAKLRDGETCTWPGGCTIPIRYCELHHLEFWTLGGATSHANSAHICRFHHWLVHHKSWTLWRDTTGTLQCRRT